MRLRLAVVKLAVFFALFAMPAQASRHCADAVIAAVGVSHLRLLNYLRDNPSSFVGAFKLGAPVEQPKRVVVFVDGPEAFSTVDGRGAGNDARRLLSSSTMVLNQRALDYNRFTFFGDWFLKIASTSVLGHELLNPGVLRNSLPMIPVLVGAFFGPNLVANLVSLQHRWFSGSPLSDEVLVKDLSAYLGQIPDRRGTLNRLFNFWRKKPSGYVQIIDLSTISENDSAQNLKGIVNDVAIELLAHEKPVEGVSTVEDLAEALEEIQ